METLCCKLEVLPDRFAPGHALMLYLALGMIVVGWTGLALTVGWIFGGMARMGEE